MGHGVAGLIGFVFGELRIGAEIEGAVFAAEESFHHGFGEEQEISVAVQFAGFEEIVGEFDGGDPCFGSVRQGRRSGTRGQSGRARRFGFFKRVTGRHEGGTVENQYLGSGTSLRSWRTRAAAFRPSPVAR